MQVITSTRGMIISRIYQDALTQKRAKLPRRRVRETTARRPRRPAVPA